MRDNNVVSAQERREAHAASQREGIENAIACQIDMATKLAMYRYEQEDAEAIFDALKLAGAIQKQYITLLDFDLMAENDKR